MSGLEGIRRLLWDGMPRELFEWNRSNWIAPRCTMTLEEYVNGLIDSDRARWERDVLYSPKRDFRE
jgi:hypothetical protein